MEFQESRQLFMSVSNETNPATVHRYPLQLPFIGKAVAVKLFAVATNSSDR